MSHILLDKDGERAIIMAPASTGEITGDVFEKHFKSALENNCTIATTEISQLPLSGVQKMLDISNNIGASSFLDVDVPPSVAVGDAALGNLTELLKCVKSCDVMKPTLEAAGELLAVAKSNGTSCDPDEVGIELDSTLGGVAEQLLNTFSSPKFVAVTDGKRGCGLAIIDDDGNMISTEVEGFEGINQIDATGAGDAFFGGLVASVHRLGMPKTIDDMALIGKISGAAGAACCEVLGALPEPSTSTNRMVDLVPSVKEWV